MDLSYIDRAKEVRYLYTQRDRRAKREQWVWFGVCLAITLGVVWAICPAY